MERSCQPHGAPLLKCLETLSPSCIACSFSTRTVRKASVTTEGPGCKVQSAFLVSVTPHFQSISVLSQVPKWAWGEHCDFIFPVVKLSISGSASAGVIMSSVLILRPEVPGFAVVPAPPLPCRATPIITRTVGFQVGIRQGWQTLETRLVSSRPHMAPAVDFNTLAGPVSQHIAPGSI